MVEERPYCNRSAPQMGADMNCTAPKRGAVWPQGEEGGRTTRVLNVGDPGKNLPG